MSETQTAPDLGSLEFFTPDWAADPLSVPQSTVSVSDVRPEPRRAAPGTVAVEQRPVVFGPKPPEIDEQWDSADLDWEMIKEMRVQATNRLTEISQARDNGLSEEEEQALGGEIINELLDNWLAAQMRNGFTPSSELMSRLEKAIHDELFGMGRLQPLLESKWIENIEINGCDRTTIELIDGRLVDGPKIAESDEQLIRDVQFWASRAKVPRPFSPAHPAMNLPLGERARMAAMAWVTLRPQITIRIHGMVKVTFEDLIRRQTITPVMANFLSAVVRSGESIVVAGAQGAGKTTLCRALCAALPSSERLITLESDRELHLEQMPDQHPRVFGIEARQGSGEFRGDGREAGLYTLSDGLKDSLRHNGDRLLVGEVRGSEIMAMIQAMQSGTGSISTAHARSARDTYQRLVTCALEQEGVGEAYANRAVASAINYVAFIKKVPSAGERVRRVTEIVAIELTADGVSFTDVFADRGDGYIAAAHLPPRYDDLVDAGFDYDAFVAEASR